MGVAYTRRFASGDEDSTIKSPTECNAPTNPKYAFKETFESMKFTETYAKMSYIWKPTGGRNRKRKLSPLRKGKIHKHLGKEQVFGSPNDNFLKLFGLNQPSHPMDWVHALLPIMPADNVEDVGLQL